MSLTIVENFSGKLEGGTRTWKFITITHDETTSTFTAGSVNLTHIDFAMAGGTWFTSLPADTSTILNHQYVTVEGKTTMKFKLIPKASSKSKLMLIGW